MGWLLWKVYVAPIPVIVGLMIGLIILWSVAEGRCGKSRWWKFFNGIVFAVITVAIIYTTLYHRSEAVSDVILTPFHSFIEARIQPEIYRSMLMNVFLFEPLGLALSNILFRRCHPILLTILFGLIFSSAIERLQYYYALGRCEVDDIIMNTLGTAIGCVPVILVKTGVVEKAVAFYKRKRNKQ